MTINRREFLRAIGLAGVVGMQGGLVGTALAQAIRGVRPAFSGRFRLASSPMIGSENLDGIRLRWNYPLFGANGDFERCLPQKVLVHREVRKFDANLFLPGDPDVGLRPVGVYPRFLWEIKNLVQLSSAPAKFGIRDAQGAVTSTEALTFEYHGPEASLKIIGLDGQCLLIAPLRDGNLVYFDAGEIRSFEIDGFGAGAFQLIGAQCLDIDAGGDFRINGPIADITVRQALSDRLDLMEGARRVHAAAGSGGPTTTLPADQSFLDATEWLELVDLASEIAAEYCVGSPALETAAGGVKVARIDLFMLALLSRWEMAPRLGFGFRDGPDGTSSGYDKLLGPPLTNVVSDEIAYYQVEAIWDGGEVQISNVASTRLDRRFPLSKPTTAGYFAQRHSELQSDFIVISPRSSNAVETQLTRDEFVGETTVRWTHPSGERAGGVLVTERLTHEDGKEVVLHEWVQHRGVYGGGFSGNVRRALPVDIGSTVLSGLRAFDSWDQLADEDYDIEPAVVVEYAPGAPKLACAAFLAEPSAPTGRIILERLVTAQGFRPSCLAVAGEEDTSQYGEWKPDPLFRILISRGYHFRLQILESVRKPIMQESNIIDYGHDSFGAFVRLDPLPPLEEFVGGSLDAQNGRYFVRTFFSDRVYIGRFSDDLTSALPDKGSCLLGSGTYNVNEMEEPVSGRCQLTQNYDDESFWQEVFEDGDISDETLSPIFIFDSPLARPLSFPDTVDYRCRVIGKRNAEVLKGELSNIVSAQRTAVRPPAPKGFRVRQLGYDYYDRLLVGIELADNEPPGSFGVAVAPGEFADAAAFAAVSERASVIGPQLLGADRIVFEALNIRKNFQTDRVYSIGVSRVNEAGTFGPATIVPIRVSVE